MKKCLDYYDVRPFIKKDGSYDMRPVPLLVHSIIKHENIDVKPYYYFSPKDYNVGKIAISEETYCVHHFDGKWLKKGTLYTFKRCIHCMLYYSLVRKGHNEFVHFLRKLKKWKD